MIKIDGANNNVSTPINTDRVKISPMPSNASDYHYSVSSKVAVRAGHVSVCGGRGECGDS